MSNICLKLTSEKKWGTQNFDFINLKSLPLGKLLEPHKDVGFPNFLLEFKSERYGSKTLCGFCIIFVLKRIMTF